MLLISTSSLKGYWIHKIFSIVKNSNYDWIDLSVDFDDFDSFDKDYLKQISDDFWVKILSITAPPRWMTKEKIDILFELTFVLNAQIITFSPPHTLDKNGEYFSSYINKLKDQYDFAVAIKNIEQKFLLFIIPEYRNTWFIDLKKFTWFTSLDLSAIDKSAWTDLVKAQNILWNSIKNVYFSDKLWSKVWLLPWQSWGGMSHLPLESFLMKLKASWYNWFFSLNVSPKELWVWSEKKIQYNLDQIKIYYKRHFVDFNP